jgi:DNA-binding response OmpR family regulator
LSNYLLSFPDPKEVVNMVQPSSSGKSILVVEDEPVIAQVCSRTLSAEGFHVEVAVNGMLALEVLSQKEYDLCLIDIRTPSMNGMQLYEHLAEKHSVMTDRIIFTTGDILSGNTKAFLEKTNRPYLPKPFTPDELRAIVRNALGTKV